MAWFAGITVGRRTRDAESSSLKSLILTPTVVKLIFYKRVALMKSSVIDILSSKDGNRYSPNAERDGLPIHYYSMPIQAHVIGVFSGANLFLLVRTSNTRHSIFVYLLLDTF